MILALHLLYERLISKSTLAGITFSGSRLPADARAKGATIPLRFAQERRAQQRFAWLSF
jgi:hypothetical protein